MTQKTKKVLEWVIFSFLTLILLLSASLLFYQRAYAGKIYRGVKVADIDLSGKTKTQAEALLQSRLTNILTKDIILQVGSQTATAKVSDTGLGIDSKKIVAEAYSVGRDVNFFRQAYFSAETVFKPSKVELATDFDQTKFNAFLAEKIPGLGVPAKNAELKIENGVVTIINEQYGQTPNTEDLAEKVLSIGAKKETSASFTIPLEPKQVAPTILAANLGGAKSTAENYLAKKVNLSYNGNNYSPSGTEIGKWISFVANGNTYTVQLDDGAIKTYLTVIAKNFEIKTVDTKINAVDNNIIEQGKPGLYLDKNNALVQIKKQMSGSSTSTTIALSTYTEDPKEVKVFPAEGIVPGRFEGKYIDIDLAQQKLCMIESMNILGCFTISSGKPSTPTPVGTRYILDKNPRAWSAPYGLYMPWWQGMGGGYGIHELPEWPGGFKEGENHLGTPVSHGCVRLGVGAAETVYNWAPIGTPVYIHK